MARAAELEGIEQAGMADLFDAAPASAAARIERVGGAQLFLAPGRRSSVSLNRVLGLGVEAEVGERELDALCALGAGSGLPWSVSLAPGPAAQTLECALAARGFTPGYAWMKFVRDTARPPAADTTLRIQPVARGQELDFARVIVESFDFAPSLLPWIAALPGRPGWQCLVACDGDRVVATGATFARGDVAWLGFDATLPSHRRWGAQNALLSRRIEGLAAAGVARVVAETGERVAGRPSHSYRNLLRAGFREVYLRPNLRCPGFDALEARQAARGSEVVTLGAPGVG